VLSRQESVTGVPLGLEINVGGQVVVAPDGTRMIVGGTVARGSTA
jgi:hypothetical protein